MTLSARQEAFCQEYARSGNASDAYKRAGYVCKSNAVASACATRLLKSDSIKSRIAELTEETRKASIAEISEIHEFLTSIIRGEDLDEKLVTDEMGRLTREGVKVQANQIKAAELLAKMRGGFSEAAQVSVTVPVFMGEGEILD